jgi:hypothetical protein
MNHEGDQVRTFINGTLFSLISRQEINQLALKMGINEHLQYQLDNCDEKFGK